MGVNFIDMHLMGVHIIGVYLMGDSAVRLLVTLGARSAW
jgi:hypothetical protein